ncbi:MAG: hypothetical protein ACI4CC_04785 [Lachnospiraceae bacterium]
MNKFGKKIIAIALALMCMAVVGVVSASAATTEYWINRPYSSAPVLSGSHSTNATNYRHVKGDQSADRISLNDSKNRSVVEFNDYSFATHDPKVHRTGGDTSFAVNTKNGGYNVDNFSVLYKEGNKIGGHATYSASTPKTGAHYFTPNVSFSFD